MLENYKLLDTPMNLYQIYNALLKIAVLSFKYFNPHPTKQSIL